MTGGASPHVVPVADLTTAQRTFALGDTLLVVGGTTGDANPHVLVFREGSTTDLGREVDVFSPGGVGVTVTVDGRLYSGSYYGLRVFDGTSVSRLADVHITDLTLAPDDHSLLLATTGGLEVYDPSTGLTRDLSVGQQNTGRLFVSHSRTYQTTIEPDHSTLREYDWSSSKASSTIVPLRSYLMAVTDHGAYLLAGQGAADEHVEFCAEGSCADVSGPAPGGFGTTALVGQRVYWWTRAGELWTVLDGSLEAERVGTLTRLGGDLFVAGSKLLASADGGGGRGLWAIDGTEASLLSKMTPDGVDGTPRPAGMVGHPDGTSSVYYEATYGNDDQQSRPSELIDVEATNLTSTDATNGIAPSVEHAVPSLAGGNGDGNGDQVPDDQQADVASLPFDQPASSTLRLRAAAGAGAAPYATLSVTGNYQLSNVRMAGGSASGVDLRRLQYRVEGAGPGLLHPGGTVEVSLYLASTAGISSYDVLSPSTGTWSPLPASRFRVVDGHRISLTLTDGGVGDSDGVADGVIAGPGVSPTVPVTTPPTTLPTPVVAPVAPALPTAVQGLRATALKRGALVSWQASGGGGVTGYAVQVAATAAGPWRDAGSSTGTSVAIKHLRPGKKVWLRVAATSTVGQGPWSGPVKVKPRR